MPGAIFCGSCGSRFDAEADAVVDPLVGKTLNGTYLIQQKIGSGGMGDVYRAIHTKLESPVALKIVKPALLAHPAMIHRFEREARAASKLRHPNVVTVTDFGQSADGMLFMVMEYVAGKSLAQVIAEDAPLLERRVVHIGAQILSALAEAHANQILHRDLKPENVMIEPRRGAPDSVKVLDFGIAKVLALGGAASTLTQAGLVCGTPGYMSPEQLRGGDVDARSDLFSLGVVLYEMLTHKLPFDSQTPMEMLHRHLSDPVPPPSQRRGRPVSPALERIVLQALSTTREERPASAEAMRDALLAATLTAAEPSEHDTGVPTEVLPRRPSSRPASTPGAARARPATAPAARPPSGATGRPTTPPPSGATGRPTTPPIGRTRTRERARREGSTSGTGTATPSSTRAQPIDKRLEQRLAPLVGPVAPYLVRKVSQAAATVGDACAQLAAFIVSPEDRKAFLAWCSTELEASAPPRPRPATPSAATPVRAWDPAVLDRARTDLAAHVGPLARVLVRRVSPRARDVRELYELLSLEIPGDAAREAFRRLAPREE
jgi:eukaryotic-like serine/threonine-protein kinase